MHRHKPLLLSMWPGVSIFSRVQSWHKPLLLSMWPGVSIFSRVQSWHKPLLLSMWPGVSISSRVQSFLQVRSYALSISCVDYWDCWKLILVHQKYFLLKKKYSSSLIPRSCPRNEAPVWGSQGCTDTHQYETPPVKSPFQMVRQRTSWC